MRFLETRSISMAGARSRLFLAVVLATCAHWVVADEHTHEVGSPVSVEVESTHQSGGVLIPGHAFVSVAPCSTSPPSKWCSG